jgi:hypothetical protein
MKHQGGDPAETALHCAVFPDPKVDKSTIGESIRSLSSFHDKERSLGWTSRVLAKDETPSERCFLHASLATQRVSLPVATFVGCRSLK